MVIFGNSNTLGASLTDFVVGAVAPRKSAYDRAETDKALVYQENLEYEAKRGASKPKGNPVTNHRRITDFMRGMEDYIGLTVDSTSYPLALVGDYRDPMYSGNVDNTIYIPNRMARSGDAIGEECAHALRDLITSTVDLPREERVRQMLSREKNIYTENDSHSNPLVHEFFGYLGRKIARRVAVKEDRLSFNEEVPINMYDKDLTLNEIRGFMKAHEQTGAHKMGKKTWQRQEYDDLKRREHSIMVHALPYFKAQQVDIDNVDLRKLFLMTDDQVMSRYLVR